MRAVRVNANKQFNGEIFPASLDQVSSRRLSPEAISCGCRADGARYALCPLNEVGARHPIF
jgi:hypothetical protein